MRYTKFLLPLALLMSVAACGDNSGQQAQSQDQDNGQATVLPAPEDQITKPADDGGDAAQAPEGNDNDADQAPEVNEDNDNSNVPQADDQDTTPDAEDTVPPQDTPDQSDEDD